MTDPNGAPNPNPPERPKRAGQDALYGVKDLTGDTAQKLVRAIEGSHPVRTLRGSQVATAIVGTVGFALFLVGIENAIAEIPSSRTAGAPWSSASFCSPPPASSSAGS